MVHPRHQPPLAAFRMETAVGPLVGIVDTGLDGALVRLDFARASEPAQPPTWRGLPVTWEDDPAALVVMEQITEYFSGTRRTFALKLSPEHGGSFDRRVWSALPELAPFGTTCTYGEIARRLGYCGAARAVGRANATNPISLVVPCHRVVGTDGRLVGYGGGDGVTTKRALLAHEASVLGLELTCYG